MNDPAMKQLILIVDDAPENIDVLVNILRSHYEIKAAINGARAIKIAKAEPKPDMILLDITMPGMDGYEVCRRLKEDSAIADIPVIFITGSINIESQKRGFDLGAVDYITRPLSPPVVRSRIKTHLQLYDQNRVLEEKVRQRTADLEKKRLELLRSETHLRTLINTLPDLVWLKDPQGRYLSCNAKVERFFGATQAEIVGKTDHDFVNEKLADSFNQEDQTAMAAGRVCMNEEEIIYTDDGHREILETIKTPMYDAEGNLIGVLGIGRDITERKKLEEQVLHTQKMKAIGTLAGGIAHDFNNILSSVMGYTELALFSLPEKSQATDQLNHVFTASLRAKDLIGQILTSSRQMNQDQQSRPVQAGLIVKEALKLIQSTFPSTIQLHTEITSGGMLFIDPGQLYQIVMNLCTNARYAMQEDGGSLTVTLKDMDIEPHAEVLDQNPELRPGPYIRLSVEDTGHGMPPEVMQRIFEPYFTTREKDVGAGLGLAMVHGITKSCGGAIVVESHQGKGTILILYLPRTDSEKSVEEREENAVLQKAPGGSERILFVDDEATLVNIGRNILEYQGYQVVTKENGLDALREFSERPDDFDAVITDMTMPQMTGEKLARELIRIRPEIPVIMCTGFSERIDDQKAKALGVKAFLMKPFTLSHLTKTLREVLDSR